MKEVDPTQNSKFPRMSVQMEGDSSEEEEVSDVDEVIQDEGFDQVEGEGFLAEGDEEDSDDESKQREELEQYADDVFDEEEEDEDVDMEEDDQSDEDED